MRKHGNKTVSWIFTLVVFEQFHQPLVEEPNGALKKAKKIRAAEGPPVLQQNVVLLLDADARQLPEHVEAVGDLLELYQVDPAIPRLVGNDGLQRNRRVAMPPSRVVVDDKDFLHCQGFCHSRRAFLESTLHAMWRTV